MDKLKFFLGLKHWQLFLLVIIPNIYVMVSNTVLSTISLMITLLIYLTWIFTIGDFIYEKLGIKKDFRKNVYFIAFIIQFELLASFLDFNAFDSFFLTFLIFFLSSILGIIGFYKLFSFSACAIREYELSRNVQIKECYFELFMFIFYFIGIWVIQPRVNRIFD
jgi:hypothetical protein